MANLILVLKSEIGGVSMQHELLYGSTVSGL